MVIYGFDEYKNKIKVPHFETLEEIGLDFETATSAEKIAKNMPTNSSGSFVVYKPDRLPGSGSGTLIIHKKETFNESIAIFFDVQHYRIYTATADAGKWTTWRRLTSEKQVIEDTYILGKEANCKEVLSWGDMKHYSQYTLTVDYVAYNNNNPSEIAKVIESHRFYNDGRIELRFYNLSNFPVKIEYKVNII